MDYHPKKLLFTRVITNRLWHYHFGAGLIKTPNDLGFSGGHPSHPELLDWLALELEKINTASNTSQVNVNLESIDSHQNLTPIIWTDSDNKYLEKITIKTRSRKLVDSCLKYRES